MAKMPQVKQIKLKKKLGILQRFTKRIKHLERNMRMELMTLEQQFIMPKNGQKISKKLMIFQTQ
jgi:hypothetical protein